MSELTFEKIRDECVAGETVFLQGQDRRLFVGWLEDGRLVTQLLDNDAYFTTRWDEHEIKNWTIERPKLKTRNLRELLSKAREVFEDNRRRYVKRRRNV